MFEQMLQRTAEQDDPVVLSDVDSLPEVDESEFDSDEEFGTPWAHQNYFKE